MFWNIDDYPIPVDATNNLGPIFGDISKALHLMGFRDGHMTMWLYSEQLNYDRKEVGEAEVIYHYLPQSEFPHNNTLFCSSFLFLITYVMI